MMNKFKDFLFLKRLGAFLVFIISFIVYALTAEPTVSFWDAGEFISTSAKLQVGHPPGAPLYQMVGAVIAGLSPSADKTAFFINLLSGLASALAVAVLFLTIVEILLYDKDETYRPSTAEAIAVLGSAWVGSLGFAFTDTFWFSAVEAEVYAPATFLSALLFWLGLKWTKSLDKKRANKWLILIAFIIGLSFGVHFMALLTIPAIGMLWFFKKYEHFDKKKFILANVVVVLILVVIFKVLMPSILKYFSALEIFFVNSVGLPFHWGTLIAGLILVFVFYKLLQKAKEKNHPLLETATLSFIYLLIGFSTWIMLPIRSNAYPPINENTPASARELLAYYNREQYGETYLFYGPYYTAYFHGLDEQKPYVDDKPKYEKDTVLGKYVIVNNYKKAKQNLTRKHKGLLPRMWDPSKAANYEMIMGYRPGRKAKPSLLDNLLFFWDYQLGYMYWRYFLWNFVGRQDDVQGHLDNHGNWLSGIKFIDELFLGNQDKLPAEYKNNPARNTYYFLPLIFGLLGLFFHYKKDWKTFYAVLLFFIFTGIAVIFYTNVKPFEPRERDYSVVVSFYAFSIWMGMGVYALYDFLKKKFNPKWSAILVTLFGLLAVPALLAKENWNDHDRSRKYSARNNAFAYLDSTDKNSILFTVGDNDTFPLWYAQEVEGHRTDVKVVNTSLLATDWYIDQMKHKSYDAPGAPIKIPHKKYVYGTRDIIIYQPLLENDTLDLKDFLKIVLSDKEITRSSLGSYFINPQNNQKVYVYPTRYIRVPVNKENAIKYGIVKPEDSAKIEDFLIIDTKGQDMYKSHLAMLDILNNFDWKRPLYFSGGSYDDASYIWLKDYLQLEGLAYKLVPVKTPASGGSFMGRVDPESMYEKIKRFKWGNIDKGIYLDPETRRNSLIYRGVIHRLAETLINRAEKTRKDTVTQARFNPEEDIKRAVEVLDLVYNKMPLKYTGYYHAGITGVQLYYRAGAKEKARRLAREIADYYLDKFRYYASLDRKHLFDNINDVEMDLNFLSSLLAVLQQYDREYFEKINAEVQDTLKPLEKYLQQ